MKKEDLDDILKVQDIQAYLKIGKSQAYELIHQKNFPVIQNGKSIRISKEKFLLWLDSKNAFYKEPEFD